MDVILVHPWEFRFYTDFMLGFNDIHPWIKGFQFLFTLCEWPQVHSPEEVVEHPVHFALKRKKRIAAAPGAQGPFLFFVDRDVFAAHDWPPCVLDVCPLYLDPSSHYHEHLRCTMTVLILSFRPLY